ncbi:hypothetical protein [Pelagicoccus enzymogenes]|nr:hypothetical protein [Pelagicoccus enzymogenes]
MSNSDASFIGAEGVAQNEVGASLHALLASFRLHVGGLDQDWGLDSHL